ncbi:MAG: NADP-dependent malic enzyme, partial [Alphaproteobacteria bacterium]|nr:NADP-dependent malic enzyme [Alphaproteobacteria bacterium]
EGMNQWKSAHAVKTSKRTLGDAMEGADAFFGLSVKGAVTQQMVKGMAAQPIIFAMANPDPEITPEEAKAARPDAIVATGRSDYPNQVNNVLGFPFIFRGALDVRAKAINEQMKIAAVHALAQLAREDVPDEVDRAYAGRRLRYGPEYIIPVPFDPRLIEVVPSAVAKAAMDSGVARRPIKDMKAYRVQLRARLDPTASSLQGIFEAVRSSPRRIVFAEGEEERVIRAAAIYRDSGYGTPVLVGREERILNMMKQLGIADTDGIEIHNARLSQHNAKYTDFLYKRLQRRGYLHRDCQRLVNTDRNCFAACMTVLGDADGMVSGLTRSYAVTLDDIARVIPPKPHSRLFGLSVMIARGRTVFISDTQVHELPTPEQLADIAVQSAAKARELGHEPRVALLSFSNFGNPMREKAQRIREAIGELDRRQIDFEYDGEMSADVALDHELMRATYPFCRLSGPANVLVMPALHTANIASKLLQQLGGGVGVGPILIGLSRPAQIVQMGSTVSDIVTAACIAAYETTAGVATLRKATAAE